MIRMAYNIPSSSIYIIDINSIGHNGNTLPKQITVSSSLNNMTQGLVIGTSNTTQGVSTYKLGNIITTYSSSVYNPILNYCNSSSYKYKSIYLTRNFIAIEDKDIVEYGIYGKSGSSDYYMLYRCVEPSVKIINKDIFTVESNLHIDMKSGSTSIDTYTVT